MRIQLQHSNGARLEVSGFGARRYAREWLAAQSEAEEKSDAEEERPKVVGTDSYFSSAVERGYEYGASSHFQDMPVVFGFVNNERNWR